MKDRSIELDEQVRMTRWVHVALGLILCAVGSVLLVMSLTGLDYLGANGEPGPGFVPSLVSGVLAGLGLALALIWLIRPPDPSAESAVLSLERADLIRAGAVWFSLVGFAVADRALRLPARRARRSSSS